MRDLRRRARATASSLPLRLRLVAGFVVAVSVVLVLAGTFVYWRVEYALDRRLDRDLRADAAAISPDLAAGRPLGGQDAGLPPAARRYQVLNVSGRVLAHGSDVGDAPLLTPAQAARARRGQVVVNVGALLPVSRRPLRVLAGPLAGRAAGTVVVVADRRDQRDEALRELLGQLAAAGLATLSVTALVGDRLARAALTPVERYRAQAADIAAGATGVRLDVPPSRDDEVTRLGHTLNDVLDALERALARERQFTQDASHELRTPLTLLSARVQLALRRPRTTAEHEQVLRELGQDVAALASLAEQLLDLTTSGQRHGAWTTATHDLRDLARRVVQDDARVRLRVPPDAEPVPVDVPAPELVRVLSNLVGNALLHGTPPVTVQVRRGERCAVVTVHDPGPGVAPEFLAVATDRFARADVARSRPGAGLGLALVRDLIEASGGELRLCSGDHHHRYGSSAQEPCDHPLAGMTATVLLPLAQTSPPRSHVLADGAVEVQA